MDEKLGDLWGSFWNEAEKTNTQKTSQFCVEPVTSQVFFRDWVRTPLFPRQQTAIDAAFTPDYSALSTVRDFILAWGKGSGKDLTIAQLMCYIIYWLCCMNDPQETLGIKSGEPIDIVNVSFDADQAQSVFFEKFIRKIKDTVNPITGKNFFEEMGMDLKKAILKDGIMFPKNIRCWSLNSKEFKAEGKNIVFAIFDEIGSFRFDKAMSIHKHIRTSAMTRCPVFHKMFFISFLTAGSDYMAHLIEKAESGGTKNCYFDRAATWDIRSSENCPKELLKYTVNKETYKEEFDEDPATAMLMYECKIPKFRSNNFIKRADKITACVSMDRPSPIVFPSKEEGDTVERFWSYNLMAEELEPWFRPFHTWEIEKMERDYEKNPTTELEQKIKLEKERHSQAEYFIHLDLSRGVVDTAGIVLGHSYPILDKTKVYIDLQVAIRADKSEVANAEIQFEPILDFVVKKLKKGLKFPISKLTADGWNSALFLELCNKAEIPAEILSIDKDRAVYDTLKDYLYREDLNLYYYPTTIRELTELIVDEKTNKVDHLSKSNWRMKEEGLPKGSKDIGDCLAGVTYTATRESSGEPFAFAKS